ncbi:MAG: leucyl aminopeptidase, partial [Desulfobulbus sp.]|nr:leucyl aminopeptidase [Desulfobulbus sp.]
MLRSSFVHTRQISIQLFEAPVETFSGDLLVFFVEEGGPDPAEFNENFVEFLNHIRDIGDFKGGQDESFLVYPGLIRSVGEDGFQAKRLLFIGFGKKGETRDSRREQLRLSAGRAVRQADVLKVKEMLVVLPKDDQLDTADVAECVSEGLLLGNYRFDAYKKPKEDKDAARVEKFLLSADRLTQKDAHKGIERGRILAEAVNAARDMANQPGNSWTPASFADYAQRLAEKLPLQCRILDRADLEELKMGGILGVNQGSALPPYLVTLEYGSAKTDPTVLLVGKGLTFDSGGICTKPPAGMEDMKYDMCGGAAVLAVMEAIAGIGVTGVHVVGLIPATENLSGPAALKPGDIIRHYNGTTSEIINTDAEGRLILADALAYGIDTYKPEVVVDVATLTGAVIIGLGHHYTGLLTNNDALAARMTEAGARVGEPLWRLPLGPEYRKQIDSKVADIKNAGSDRSAGTITAACYLQEFVGEVPWAHLDIAGTAWDFT